MAFNIQNLDKINYRDESENCISHAKPKHVCVCVYIWNNASVSPVVFPWLTNMQNSISTTTVHRCINYLHFSYYAAGFGLLAIIRLLYMYCHLNVLLALVNVHKSEFTCKLTIISKIVQTIKSKPKSQISCSVRFFLKL